MDSVPDGDEAWEIEGRVRLETADYLHAWFYVPEFRTIWQYLLFLPFGSVVMVVGSPVPWRSWLSVAPWMLGPPDFSHFSRFYDPDAATGSRVGTEHSFYCCGR